MVSYFSTFLMFGSLCLLASIILVTLITMLMKHKIKKISTLIPTILLGLLCITIIIFPGRYFLFSLTELPDVLSNNTQRYKGMCDIEINKSSRGGDLIYVNFEKYSIHFSSLEYKDLQEGTYDCKVEYYPITESGDTLQLDQITDDKKAI